MKTCLLAATVLLCASNPLNAAQSARDTTTLAVRLGDLDLMRPEGRRALDARLAAAARSVCGSLTIGSPIEWIARARCERETHAQARQMAAMAVAAAEARQRSQLARNAAVR
jgi:UrcA family protein